MDHKILIQHFWSNANIIISRSGVEIALHRETTVEVSVMICNCEQHTEKYQLHLEYGSLENFIVAFDIKSLEDLNNIDIKDLYRNRAQLNEIISPV